MAKFVTKVVVIAALIALLLIAGLFASYQAALRVAGRIGITNSADVSLSRSTLGEGIAKLLPCWVIQYDSTNTQGRIEVDLFCLRVREQVL